MKTLVEKVVRDKWRNRREPKSRIDTKARLTLVMSESGEHNVKTWSEVVPT